MCVCTWNMCVLRPWTQLKASSSVSSISTFVSFFSLEKKRTPRFCFIIMFMCIKRWSTACLTAKRTAGGAGATGCRTSSRPSSQSGSERRRPGPSSAPAGSGHRRWAAPRRCPSRPETRRSCSGARSPDGRSSTRNACGRESQRIAAETVDGVESHTRSIWVLVDEKWETLKGESN